jgi:ArsR family transcriptional regulator
MVASIEIGKLQESANEACQLLKTLGNADRLLLICEISRGERCVGELEERLGIRQPTLSQQLTILRKEGLVNTRREGKQIFYTLTSAKALDIINALYKSYCNSN